MKVTNDLIDMVTEACMDISLRTKQSYEDCVVVFLIHYLGTPITMDALLHAAKKTKTHEEWKAAYEQFHAAHFKDSPYKARKEEE